MGLPIQSTPTYTCVLPSDGREIKYRPFLVKEQKILTLAKESDDEKAVFEAVKELLNAVCITEIDSNELPIIDMEYLFLKVRSVSVGETSKVTTGCDTVDCKGSVELIVNLNEIEAEGINDDGTVMINDDVGVVLTAPKVKHVVVGDDDTLGLICKCVVRVFDNENVYEATDMTDKDMLEFIESLTFKQLELITEFFDNLPKLSHEVEGKCNICDSTTKRTLEGINTFF